MYCRGRRGSMGVWVLAASAAGQNGHHSIWLIGQDSWGNKYWTYIFRKYSTCFQGNTHFSISNTSCKTNMIKFYNWLASNYWHQFQRYSSSSLHPVFIYTNKNTGHMFYKEIFKPHFAGAWALHNCEKFNTVSWRLNFRFYDALELWCMSGGRSPVIMVHVRKWDWGLALSRFCPEIWTIDCR